MARYEDLAGKVVLVTGGSGGLGREIVRAFHYQDCKVALNYKSSEAQAEELARELGSGVEVFQGDVANREDVKRMILDIEKSLGSVEILINNAGISFPMEFEKIDELKLDNMWRVNVIGTINTSLEVLAGMKKSKGGGVITNIASHAGLGNPRPYGTFYSVTKSALITLTKRMALELGNKYEVRVNGIAPGVIQVDHEGSKMSDEEALQYEQRLGLKRILRHKGLPRHIADTALFLSSKASAFMTGQVLAVDGGRLDSLPRSI